MQPLKSPFFRSALPITLLFGILPTTTACGKSLTLGNDNGGVIFVSSVFSPVAPTDGVCSYASSENPTSESGGVVDVSFSLSDYTPALLVGNLATGQDETSRVVIVGAVTQITDLAGDNALIEMFMTMCDGGDEAACKTVQGLDANTVATPVNPFRTVETGDLSGATSGSPGYSAVAVTLVDGGTVALFRDYFANLWDVDPTTALTKSIQILTYTQVMGTTLGGEMVTSNTFEFPVTMSYGSLVENLTKNGKGDYCLRPPPVNPPSVCVPGQDSPSFVPSFSGLSSCNMADGGVSSTDAGADG